MSLTNEFFAYMKSNVRFGDITQVNKLFIWIYWFVGIYWSKQGRYLLVYNFIPFFFFLGNIALEQLVKLYWRRYSWVSILLVKICGCRWPQFSYLCNSFSKAYCFPIQQNISFSVEKWLSFVTNFLFPFVVILILFTCQL